jgi:hypothetical protein
MGKMAKRVKPLPKQASEESLYFTRGGKNYKITGTRNISGYWETQIKNLETKQSGWVDSAKI